jgi:hypothetical protein
MRGLRLPTILAAAALAVGCAGGAYYDYGPGYGYTPELAYVSPGLSVVVGYPEPIFYTSGYYWRYSNDRWYRSPYWDRGWSYYARPPRVIARIDQPYRYRYYRGDRYYSDRYNRDRYYRGDRYYQGNRYRSGQVYRSDRGTTYRGGQVYRSDRGTTYRGGQVYRGDRGTTYRGGTVTRGPSGTTYRGGTVTRGPSGTTYQSRSGTISRGGTTAPRTVPRTEGGRR